MQVIRAIALFLARETAGLAILRDKYCDASLHVQGIRCLLPKQGNEKLHMI